MRTVYFRSLSLAAVAVLTLTGGVAAQDTPSGLLNNLEVRQLVARGEPGDQAQLSAHFSALADRYAAEAKRHISMSQNFVGNPSRNLGSGMSAHCKRLADLNTQSATTARELATYHAKLASGTPATPPPGGARFQAGAGAPEPTAQELNALAAKARTPAEHRGLEEYFLTLAKRYTAEADEHVALAQTYRGTRIAQAAVHHDRLATLAKDAAKEATEGAAMHKQLADVAR
ncbi:MAG TPA: hypothetical protein VFA43_08570 [Gemmatimonadaceae bacterium]|jgi:hypothetical protein|nr:hypothetical protein [Gemmatimonadaceae bacterium]